MFYLLEVEDHVRVEPKHFGLPTREAIEKQLNESFVNSVNKEFGYIIAVVGVDNIEEGVLIPNDELLITNLSLSSLFGDQSCTSLFMEQLQR